MRPEGRSHFLSATTIFCAARAAVAFPSAKPTGKAAKYGPDIEGVFFQTWETAGGEIAGTTEIFAPARPILAESKKAS